jgi:hypothetical protein
MTARFSCARAARAADEPLYGTASVVRRWVLVEQPGPWGADAVLESRLPVTVGAALRAHARAAGARLLLIRRHARYTPVGHTCYVAVTTRAASHVETRTVDEPEALLDEVDWAALAEGHTVGWDAVDTPLYLVCTNGRHDACCAEFGRPLAAALDATSPQHTWEASHFGGDRFAGNLVCLPHGLYYGRVGPEEAPVVAAAYADGLVALAHYRGRSCDPFPAQAAEWFARRETGVLGIDDLALTAHERVSEDRFRTTFATRAGPYVAVAVRVDHDTPARQLTCRGAVASAPRYDLVAVETT